jgi:hypothetical protein
MKSMDGTALTRYPVRHDMQYDAIILRMARRRGHNEIHQPRSEIPWVGEMKKAAASAAARYDPRSAGAASRSLRKVFGVQPYSSLNSLLK